MELTLNLAEPPALQAARTPADLPRFTALPPGAPARLRVERFIATVYARHYGAQLRGFMPTLVSLGEDDEPSAAAGYRAAGAAGAAGALAEPLFLEHYLARPVEQAIAAQIGQPVARAAIVEVGQFASMVPGQGRRLMAHLGRHLADAGFAWVVSTATAELRQLFERLRIRPLVLGQADPARLGAAAADWGSYYAHAPLVLAGEIRSNLARFASPVAPVAADGTTAMTRGQA
jgi:hypothetical protein